MKEKHEVQNKLLWASSSWGNNVRQYYKIHIYLNCFFHSFFKCFSESGKQQVKQCIAQKMLLRQTFKSLSNTDLSDALKLQADTMSVTVLFIVSCTLTFHIPSKVMREYFYVQKLSQGLTMAFINKKGVFEKLSGLRKHYTTSSLEQSSEKSK